MSPKESIKPVFGPESLADLVARINDHFPKQLIEDWRVFVKGQFQMSPEQEQSFEHIPANLVEEIRQYFVQAAQHQKHNSKMHAKIAKLPVEKQTTSAVHEVHLNVESTGVPSQSTSSASGSSSSGGISIVIAHCDADCRNWGWGPPPAPPKQK